MNIKIIHDMVDAHKVFFWSVAIVLGLSFRFLVLYVTDNVDFRNFYHTASLAAEGKNIYAYMAHYNYGALLSIMLGEIFKAASFLGGSVLVFKVMYVGVLALADFIIAKVAEKKAGTLWGIAFFLNPISMIVDGYHTQFDNMAVMFGVLGVLCLEESCRQEKFCLSDISGVVLLSLSLIAKHFMWAFPLYILFSREIKTRKKILYAFVPPLLFLLGFLPYWSEGAEGIIHNVFMYRSFGNYPLLFMGFILNAGVIFANTLTNSFLLIFGGLMAISAYLVRREDIFRLFLIYTISAVSFSSGASGQQLVIPCLAMTVLFREKSLPYFALIFTRLAGKQVMLSVEAWCLLGYLVHYVRMKGSSRLN